MIMITKREIKLKELENIERDVACTAANADDVWNRLSKMGVVRPVEYSWDGKPVGFHELEQDMKTVIVNYRLICWKLLDELYKVYRYEE